MFGSYFGEIHISDGIERDAFEDPGTIAYRSVDGKLKVIYKTNGPRIREFKIIRNGKIEKWHVFGRFIREYVGENGRRLKQAISLPIHPNTKRAIHGLVYRRDLTLLGKPGVCRTRYSRGKMLWQEFRYRNQRLAYKVRMNSTELVIRFDNGQEAVHITAANGFSLSAISGSIAFDASIGSLDFKRPNALMMAKDGNCHVVGYDRKGKVMCKGEYRNRQRVGDWVVNGISAFFVSGVQVSKKLWNTKPEDLKVGSVLKIGNAQLRAALLAKIGSARIAKECRFKVIHQTKNSMKLMEFPIKLNDGNGGHASRMRILQVRCPSTKGLYYLNVPDFVWDGGKKTKLNTCEQARQWTFGVDDPRKKIKFAKET